MKFLVYFLKTIFVLIIVLMGLMTAANGNSVETILLIVSLLFILPVLQGRLSIRHGEKKAVRLRSILSIVFFVLAVVLLSSHDKQSIYKSEKYEAEAHQLYDKLMQRWPGEYEDIFLENEYGKVHIIESGNKNAPPIVCLHAASMGGCSWAMNIRDLQDDYHIFAIDNIGEIGKSELLAVTEYPEDGKEIAEFYAGLLDELGTDTAFLLAASNGGYIAFNLAYYYPERIKGMVMLGPMGLTQLTQKSIFMMSVGSMYPFKFVRDWVTGWAMGDDPLVKETTYEWFDLVVAGTMPAIPQPVPMTTEQKHEMNMPILLYLGTKDKIVGDADIARAAGEEYPNIIIETLESNHLIQIEKLEHVNSAIVSFVNEHYLK